MPSPPALVTLRCLSGSSSACCLGAGEQQFSLGCLSLWNFSAEIHYRGEGLGKTFSFSPEAAQAPGGLLQRSESTSQWWGWRQGRMTRLTWVAAPKGTQFSGLEAQAKSNKSTFIPIHFPCPLLRLKQPTAPKNTVRKTGHSTSVSAEWVRPTCDRYHTQLLWRVRLTLFVWWPGCGDPLLSLESCRCKILQQVGYRHTQILQSEHLGLNPSSSSYDVCVLGKMTLFQFPCS